LLEVLLALGLVVMSAVFLCAVFAAAKYLLGPLASSGGGRGGGLLMIGILGLGIWALKYPWTELLRYYRYEAHTLRPLKENETAPPDDAREKNEG
jgi:hypothetical protein